NRPGARDAKMRVPVRLRAGALRLDLPSSRRDREQHPCQYRLRVRCSERGPGDAGAECGRARLATRPGLRRNAGDLPRVLPPGLGPRSWEGRLMDQTAKPETKGKGLARSAGALAGLKV